jgi:ADP-ribose pyrophosphatase
MGSYFSHSDFPGLSGISEYLVFVVHVERTGMIGTMSIKTLGSRTAYENKWLRLREDEIERPDGSRGIYGVIEKPDFALIIPKDVDNFILVEQFRYTMKARYVEFPQGAWESDWQANPEDLARGELREETGFIAEHMQWLGKLQSAYGFSTQAFHVFLATGLTPGTIAPDPEEHDLVVRRASAAQFERMILSGEIVDCHTLAAYLLLKMRSGSN